MPRGGSQKHPADCKCGHCPKIGRPKSERLTDAKVAVRVLAKAKAEQLWLDMIALEKRRLGLDGEVGPHWNFSIIPLTNLLRYLEDRAYGRPVDTVNHLHDKPIEMNVNISLAEAVQKARKRVLA